MKLFRKASIMLPFVNTDEALTERRSDIAALTSWAQHSSSVEPLAACNGGAGATTTASGIAVRVDTEHVWVRSHGDASDARDASIYHHLPRSLDLQPLVGLALRATMMCAPGAGGHLERTLLLTGETGRVWLIMRSGSIHGETHTLSGSHGDDALVHATLSQRPLGPLVIGTAELQCLVPVGHSALLRMRDGSKFRALLIKRRDDGTASYVIADASLFVEKPS